MTLAAAAVAASLATASSVGQAGGVAMTFAIGGQPWPTHVITYYNAVPGQRKAVLAAVAAWNGSGVGIRFRPASRAQADLIIDPVPLDYPDYGEARATLGYKGRSTPTLDPYPPLKLAKDGRPLGLAGAPRTYYGAHLWMRQPADKTVAPLSDADRSEIVAHELGHVLGLGHSTSRCAVMRAKGIEPGLCGLKEFERYCGILTLDDIRGAAQMYGGKPGPSWNTVCSATGTLAAPASLRSEVGRSIITLRWKVPPGANGHGAAGLLGAFVRRGPAGACPTKAPVVRNGGDVDASPGGPYTDNPGPGTYCYSVWLLRFNAQTSTTPATITVTIPASQS